MINQSKITNKNIYFDHNATSPIDKNVKEAIFNMYESPLNASSAHFYGRYARQILENSRTLIKSILSLDESHELIFTSGCTEANNIVLNNFPNISKICSGIEHSSITNIINNSIIPVNKDGILDLQFIEDYCSKSSKQILLSFTYANNQTGIIQPVKKIIRLVKKYNVILHCDVTQAVGRIHIDLQDIDLITFSSHKFGGPIGSGGLLYNKILKLTPMFKGGGQEFQLRPGTHNIISIYGMSIAFKHLNSIIEKFKKTEKLRIYLENNIRNIANKAIIFGINSNRLPNTSSISMPKVNSETQLIYFDLYGLSVSVGAACSSGKVVTSNAQLMMGYPKGVSSNVVRISLGPNNHMDDIIHFVKVWETLYVNSE